MISKIYTVDVINTINANESVSKENTYLLVYLHSNCHSDFDSV
jgi:hypothetical protein